MTTTITIHVKLNNGEVQSFKDVANFQMMPQGLLFIEMPIAKNENRQGRLLVGVESRSHRHWIPFANIKDVEVLTSNKITHSDELKKYEKFLEHGIDISVTPISYTKPPSIEDVEKKIAEQERSTKTN